MDMKFDILILLNEAPFYNWYWYPVTYLEGTLCPHTSTNKNLTESNQSFGLVKLNVMPKWKPACLIFLFNYNKAKDIVHRKYHSQHT